MAVEQTNRGPQPQDIIEIIESHYVPAHPIGNKYVVVESFDGYDVWIINEHGKYDCVCGEDFKIIGSVREERSQFLQALKERDKKLFGEDFTEKDTLIIEKEDDHPQ